MCQIVNIEEQKQNDETRYKTNKPEKKDDERFLPLEQRDKDNNQKPNVTA